MGPQIGHYFVPPLYSLEIHRFCPQTGARARSQDRTYVFPGNTKGGQSNVRFEDDQQYEWSTYVPWVENPPPMDRTQLINQEISVPAPNITAINRTVGTLNY